MCKEACLLCLVDVHSACTKHHNPFQLNNVKIASVTAKQIIHLMHVQGRSVLHLAVVYGNKAMARLLLDHGADINADSGEVSGTSNTACLML